MIPSVKLAEPSDRNEIRCIIATSQEIEDYRKNVAPPNSSGCRFWLGIWRYGGIQTYLWEGKKTAVYTISYILTYGSLDPGGILHHACEIKTCCQPTHLIHVSRVAHPKIHAWIRSNDKMIEAFGL